MLTCPLPIATNKYFPDGSNANSFTSSFNDSTLIVFKFRLSRILKESSLSPYAKYVPHGDQATFKFCAINEKRMKKRKTIYVGLPVYDNFRKLLHEIQKVPGNF